MVSTGGFILGLVGGLLDFASASMLLLGQAAGADMMTGTPSSDYLLAGVLVFLGVLVVATTLFSVSVVDNRMARASPILMMAYGIVMVGIGTAMSGGYAGTGMSLIYSYGMVLVGVLMVANGIAMVRGSSQMSGS